MPSAYLILFLKSALIGLSIAAPVGPIGLLCMQRTLDAGPRIGVATGMGAAAADAVYGAIGASGVGLLMQAMTGARTWLGMASATMLLWLAWTTWRSAQAQEAAKLAAASRAAGAFASTFMLTLSNPMTILSFIAVLSSLAVGRGGVAPWLVVGGVFAGSAAWWLILVGAVMRLRRRFGARQLRLLRLASALVLAGFAVSQLASVAASLP